MNLGAHALYLGGEARRVLDELGVAAPGGLAPTSGGFAVRDGRLHTLPTGLISLLTTGLLDLSGRLEVARFLASIQGVDGAPLQSLPAAAWIERTFRTPGAPRPPLAAGARVHLQRRPRAPQRRRGAPPAPDRHPGQRALPGRRVEEARRGAAPGGGPGRRLHRHRGAGGRGGARGRRRDRGAARGRLAHRRAGCDPRGQPLGRRRAGARRSAPRRLRRAGGAGEGRVPRSRPLPPPAQEQPHRPRRRLPPLPLGPLRVRAAGRPRAARSSTSPSTSAAPGATATPRPSSPR